MPKRISDISVKSTKKKHNVITLDTKFDIIKQSDNGQCNASTSRVLGFNESPVQLILSKPNENTEQGKAASTPSSTQCTKDRSYISV